MEYPIYFKTDSEFIPIQNVKRGIWALLDIEHGYRFFHLQDESFVTELTLTKAKLETVKERVADKVRSYLERTEREGKEPPSVNKLISIIYKFIGESLDG